MRAIGQQHKFRLRRATDSCSAQAAEGDLADYFRYGFVTGHRPGNLAERQLSEFLFDQSLFIGGQQTSVIGHTST